MGQLGWCLLQMGQLEPFEQRANGSSCPPPFGKRHVLQFLVDPCFEARLAVENFLVKFAVWALSLAVSLFVSQGVEQQILNDFVEQGYHTEQGFLVEHFEELENSHNWWAAL